MQQTQSFAQRFPFYMTAETSARTIELGRALRAQIQRRRASVRIRADVTDYCAAMKKASSVVADFGAVAAPMWAGFDEDKRAASAELVRLVCEPFQCCDGVVPAGDACRRCGAEQGAQS